MPAQKNIIKNLLMMIKVLFFARNRREEVWEYDFILNEILPKQPEKSIHFLSLDQVRNCDETFDVFVYSCRDPEIYEWGYMPSYDEALECVLKLKPKVVIQLSDEYAHEDLDVHNELANYCQLFLRQHNHQEFRKEICKTPLYSYENIIHMPLGYLNDTPVNEIKILPPEQRKYNWSFVGKIKDGQFFYYNHEVGEWLPTTDRAKMIETFENSIDNYFFKESGVDKKQLVELYGDSIFVPCGRGNTSLNCFRHYEATICGAIPVVVWRWQGEIDVVFKFGVTPIPWIFALTWEDAVHQCKELLNQPEKLRELQEKNINWWNTVMNNIRDRVKSVLIRPIDLTRSEKLKNFPPVHFISIEETVERRNLLIQKFKDVGINNVTPHIFKRYKNEDHVIVSEFLNRIGQWRLSEGSRGPVTSHLKAVKQWYYETDEPYAFFCEDDLSLETIDYWNFTWDQFFERLPKDWECVQLAWIREYLFHYGDKFRNRCWCDWSACAYLISREHARKLIETYHPDDKFYLDTKGNDVQGRAENFIVPVVETIMFSSFGPIYSFPLFVEDIYGCKSSYLDLMGETAQNLNGQCDHYHIRSHDEIIEWWKTKGKNLKANEL